MGTKMLSVALAAIALGAVTVAPASAATGNPIVEIKSVDTDLCLDHNRPDGRGFVNLAACTGADTQKFERVQSPAGGFYLRNVGDGRCLNGSNWRVTRFQCGHHVPGERFEEIADEAGTVKLKSGTSFADSRYFRDYSEVTMEDAAEVASQRWLVREVGVVPPPQLGAVVKLRHAEQGTCVADSDRYFNELKPCATAPGLERIDAGAGRVALRSQETGRCMAVNGDSAVWFEDCDTTAAAQQWALTGDELGNYTVANADRNLTPWNNGVRALSYQSTSLLQRWQLLAA